MHASIALESLLDQVDLQAARSPKAGGKRQVSTDLVHPGALIHPGALAVSRLSMFVCRDARQQLKCSA